MSKEGVPAPEVGSSPATERYGLAAADSAEAMPRPALGRPGPRPIYLKNNITIEPWMVEYLGLSGSSLVIFAMVHNAGPAGLRCSMASIGWACGLSRDSVKRNLHSLMAQGAVARHGDPRAHEPLIWTSLAWQARGKDDPAADAGGDRRSA